MLQDSDSHSKCIHRKFPPLTIFSLDVPGQSLVESLQPLAAILLFWVSFSLADCSIGHASTNKFGISICCQHDYFLRLQNKRKSDGGEQATLLGGRVRVKRCNCFLVTPATGYLALLLYLGNCWCWPRVLRI